MPIDKEVQEWVDGLKAQGLTDEQIKPMLTVVEGNPNAANYLKRSVMAPSEFSRQMDALKAEKDKAQKEFEKSKAWFDSTTAWKTEKEGDYNARLERAVKAETALNAVKSKIEMLKTQGYLDDTTAAGIFEGAPSITATAAPSTAASAPKFVTDDELTKRFNTGSVGVAKFNAKLFKLNERHNRIFSKAGFDGTDYSPPEFDADKIIDHINTNGGTLEAAYNAIYKGSERQQKLTDAQTEAEVERRAEDKYRQRVSADVQAGRPVSVTPQPSNIRKMAPVPDNTKTFAQKRFDRVSRAVAQLETNQ
jgi:hypothetical protein